MLGLNYFEPRQIDDLHKRGTRQSVPSTGNSPAQNCTMSARFEKPSHRHRELSGDDYDLTESEPTLLLQPVTKSISQEQLRVELRSIYSGLVVVENKCRDVDREQTRLALDGNPGYRPALSPKQWQALIALQKTILHEFHDFFLASQHPAATPNLTKLAARNYMPARLWQFGIHNFLEVLRYRLPESLDYMLAFIYPAYSMMTLLYETVPAFANTWIECLDDLGRYRMAIEDNDRRDWETWSGVSRYWYKKAWNRNLYAGRLAHHLAVLSRPFTSEQLSLYLHALVSTSPFESARTSTFILLNPGAKGKEDITPNEWKPGPCPCIHQCSSDCKSRGVSFMIYPAAGLYGLGRSQLGTSTFRLIRRCCHVELEPKGWPNMQYGTIAFSKSIAMSFKTNNQQDLEALSNNTTQFSDHSDRRYSNSDSICMMEWKKVTKANTTDSRDHSLLWWAVSKMETKAVLLFRKLRSLEASISFVTFCVFLPTTSAAPINGNQTSSALVSSGHFSVVDCVTFSVGMAILAGSRLMPRLLHVNKSDLSLWISASAGFTWWATKNDDRSSPVFLAMYVRP